MKKHKSVFFIILFTLLVVSVGLAAVFNIEYSTADDYIINNIVSGALGDSPDYSSMYLINNILGIALYVFYNIININFYSLMLIVFLSFSYSLIIYRVIDKKSKIFLLLPILAMYLFTLFNITYTIIAYVCIAFALIDFCNRPKLNKIDFVIYIFMITIGLLLRKAVLIPIFLSMGLIIVFEIIKEKNTKKLKNMIIILAIPLIIATVAKNIFLTDDNLREFANWHEACVKIRDYEKIDYEKNKELMEEVGWTENDLNLIYTWAFADKETYSYEKLNYVADNISIFEKYNFNISDILISFFKQFTDLSNVEQTYIILFMVIFIITLIKQDKKEKVLLMFVLTICVNIMLIVRGRYLFRVVYPQYLIAMIFYIYLTAKNFDKNNGLDKALAICISLISIISIIYWGNVYYDKFNQENADYADFTEYASQNKQNLYVLDSTTYNNVTMNYSIQDSKEVGIYNNIMKLGGGDTFSKRYYYYIEKYNLENSDNLFEDLVQDNVYFVGNISEEMQLYLKEHGFENYIFTEIDKINGLTIYKFSQDS